MGRLTTHVLDTVHGVPGKNIKIELFKVHVQQMEIIISANPDQHYHAPLLVSPYGYSTYRGS